VAAFVILFCAVGSTMQQVSISIHVASGRSVRTMTRQVAYFDMVMDFLEEGYGHQFDPPAPMLGWCPFWDTVGKDQFEVAEGGSDVTERLEGYSRSRHESWVGQDRSRLLWRQRLRFL